MKPNQTKYIDRGNKFREPQHFSDHKKKAHFYFDKVWKEAQLMTRQEAYKWIADRLGVTKEEAHFTFMSDTQCVEAIHICQQVLNDNRRIDLDFGTEPITPFYIL